MKNYVWNEKYKRYFARNSEGYRLWQDGEDATLKQLVKKVDAELDALVRK